VKYICFLVFWRMRCRLLGLWVLVFMGHFAVGQTAVQLYSAQLDECIVRKSVPCLKLVVKEINYCLQTGIVSYASFDDQYKHVREIFWDNKEYELIPNMLDLDIDHKMKAPKYSSVLFVDSLLRDIMFRHYVEGLMGNGVTANLRDDQVGTIIDSELHLLPGFSQGKKDSVCELFLQLDQDAFEKGFLGSFGGSPAQMRELVGYASGDMYLLYFNQIYGLFSGKIKANITDPKDWENDAACARLLHDNIHRLLEMKGKADNISTYLVFSADYLSFFKTVDSMRKFVGTDYPELLRFCVRKTGEHNTMLPYIYNNIGDAYSALFDSTQNQRYLDSTTMYYERTVNFWTEQMQVDKHNSAYYAKDDTSELIAALENAASVLQQKGEYGKCDTTYTKILKYEKAKYGENSEAYAVSLYKAAKMEIEIGHYKNAEPKLLSLVATHKLTSDHYNNLDWILGGYSSLSRLYVKLNDFKDAQLYFDAAIALANRLSGKNTGPNAIDLDYIYGSLHNDGGYIFTYFGRENSDPALLLRAEQEYKTALSYRKKKGERDRLYIATLGDFATLEGYLGDTKAQEKCMRYIESVKDSL